MSSRSLRNRYLAEVNNENSTSNIKNSLVGKKKKTALKVVTNTIQVAKKPDNKMFKTPKLLPLMDFESNTEFIRSPLEDIIYKSPEDFYHHGCMKEEKNDLPPSMTCNISMLSNFFKSNDDDNEKDWFLEDYNNIMINKIKNTFEKFGELDIEYALPSLPILDIPLILN